MDGGHGSYDNRGRGKRGVKKPPLHRIRDQRTAQKGARIARQNTTPPTRASLKVIVGSSGREKEEQEDWNIKGPASEKGGVSRSYPKTREKKRGNTSRNDLLGLVRGTPSYTRGSPPELAAICWMGVLPKIAEEPRPRGTQTRSRRSVLHVESEWEQGGWKRPGSIKGKGSGVVRIISNKVEKIKAAARKGGQTALFGKGHPAHMGGNRSYARDL